MSEKKSEQLVDSKLEKKKQLIRLVIIMGICGAIIFAYDIISDLSNPPPPPKKEVAKKISVELATERLDGGKIWFNNLVDRLDKEAVARKEQEEKQSKQLENLEKKITEQNNSDIEVLKQQISWLKKELEETDQKIANSRQESPVTGGEEYVGAESQKIAANYEEKKAELKDSNLYIPAGSFISGVLRGGVSASTGVGAPEAPPPIFIRITGRGDLPKDFKVDLTKCRVVASGYGSIANERIIARAERLSCTDEKSGKVLETEIVGAVHGADSKNGIRGNVVSMADKHLKNAVIGGVLSGFAASAKSGENLAFNPTLGAINTKKSSLKERAGESALSGTVSAAEKIADYHMSLAEITAPVIEVAGAVPVVVFFSKGIYLGSETAHKEVKDERK